VFRGISVLTCENERNRSQTGMKRESLNHERNERHERKRG